MRVPSTTYWKPEFDNRPDSNNYRILFSLKFSRDYLNKANYLLDIGCGTGSYIQKTDRVGAIGIDLDINALKIARKYCANAEFIVSSAKYLPFKDGIFDLVCMWEVFEELPPGSESSIVMEISRALRQNGNLLLSTSNDHIVCKLCDPAFIFRGVRHYNSEKFLRFISDMGYTIDNYVIAGGFHALMSNFLFFFYKHILRKKDGRFKSYFDHLSEKEMDINNPGIVYLFVDARKSDAS